MSPVLLADDLSGALEAGAAFAVRGWETMLFFGSQAVGANAPSPSPFSRLRLVTTESRNLPASDASRRVTLALAGLAERSEYLIFKKVDSTLRGPVGAELQALLETGASPVIFAPSNPPAGRTVKSGILRVNGVPIAETAFRSDPIMPVTENSVASVIAAGGLREVVEIFLDDIRARVISESTALRFQRSGICVCDAESRNDLERVIALARHAHPAPRFVGSGGLAHALAAATPPAHPKPPTQISPVAGNVLVVSGSKHPISRAQIAAIGKNLSKDVHYFERGRGESDYVAEVERSLTVHGFACLSSGRADDDPERMAKAMGRIVAAVDRAKPLAALIVSGGETAWNICQELGSDRLEVMSELATGAVLSELSSPRGQQGLVTKPGGFGHEGTLLDLYKKLRP